MKRKHAQMNADPAVLMAIPAPLEFYACVDLVEPIPAPQGPDDLVHITFDAALVSWFQQQFMNPTAANDQALVSGWRYLEMDLTTAQMNALNLALINSGYKNLAPGDWFLLRASNHNLRSSWHGHMFQPPPGSVNPCDVILPNRQVNIFYMRPRLVAPIDRLQLYLDQLTVF